jgi:diguanylate cyclase
LNRALELARERRLDPYAWRITATLGEWWIARGDSARAREVILGLLAELGPEAPQQTVTCARVVAYRACRALGLVDEALAHFEVAERLERIRTTSQLRSQSQLFVTRGEAERARSEAAKHRARAAELAELAERDSLTGLGNRDHLDRRFSELLSEAMHETRPISVAMIDIDHFKQINDTHGHSAGDLVLVQLAVVLRQHLGAVDVIARLGGEEFVVVFPDTPARRAVEICEGLRVRLTDVRWRGMPAQARVTVSIGVSEAAPYDAVDLLRRADAAMYAAKRLGRDRICQA